MEELVDICDKDSGILLGKSISKEIAHSKGIWHTTVHLLVINKDKTKVLLQKRSNNKKLYPDIWDVSVGGHVTFAETPDIAIKREMSEELGLNSEDYIISFLDKTKEELICDNTYCYNFVYIYVLYINIETKKINIQKEELSDVKWVDKNKLNSLILNKQIVPHKLDYVLLNNLLK